MKQFFKHKSILIFLVLLKISTQAQTVSPTPYTAGGYFDEVYDKDGNKYNLKDLRVLPDDPNAAKLVSSTTSCTAGYFEVYFANGSGMELLNVTHQSRRNVICEVLANLSGMVNPTFTNSLTRVKILVDDITNYVPGGGGVLGLASGYYSFPANPASPNPGVATNMIHKTITTGQDALLGITPPIVLLGGGFYHGMMAFDFTNFTWHLGLGSVPPGGSYDLYTVALHEITHSLGFASLISFSGVSKLGPANNYYAAYDEFLCEQTGTPLLSANTASCLNYNWVYTGSNTLVAPNGTTCSGNSNITNCPTAVRYISGNLPAGTNMKVYTPNCFEPPSSLSHFEDMCYPAPPHGNDQYFVMSNANGAGTFKRYLKEEERLVLCDIGYSCVNQYTSNAILTPTFGATHNYTSTNCSSPDIWGVNDGIAGGGYIYSSLTTTVTIPIPNTTTLGILNNDSPNTSTFTCLEDVYNTGVATISGTNIVYVANPGFSGVFLLRYVPVDALGNNGNITYITGYVINSACNPVSPCNLVQNGEFETFSFPHIINPICGQISTGNNSPYSNCWSNYDFNGETPDIFTAGCSAGLSFNAGFNTWNLVPPVSPYNAIPTNSSFVGFGATFLHGNGPFAEAMKNYLGTPLVHGQVYVLSFMLRMASNPSPSAFNPNQKPMVVSFHSSDILAPIPTTVYPGTLNNPVQDFTITNNFNTWVPFSATFTFNSNSPGNLPHHTLMFGVNYTATAAYGYTASESCYAFIDDISIVPASAAPSFSLQPLLCLGNSITNLGQYAQPPGGVFSGPGVTVNSGIYDFNVSGALTPGQYIITYAVTNTLSGCTSFAVSHVSVVTNACCNPTLTAFTGTTFPTTPIGINYTSPILFMNDVVIPSGQSIQLAASEFLFAPNVKIIVSPNAHLRISYSHLYACQPNMWQGIVVQDGGRVTTTGGPNDVLIEDAIVAIDVSNNITNTLTIATPILSLSKTIFNKNHTAIKIDNYQRASVNYPFMLTECVFTSRNFTFTPSSWPNTATSGSGLRVATNPTTGLAVPYLLQNAALVNLKLPYSNQSARTGIEISNCGETSGGTYYGVDVAAPTSTSSAGLFNLFDGLMYGIDATNSNFSSINNVFQNTRRLQFCIPCYYDGGTAIRSIITNDLNARVNLTAIGTNSTNYSIGNRFWDCHRGIEASNVFRLDCNYATFRSTQAVSSATNSLDLPGEYGITNSTNRFEHTIRYNKFNNINNAIQVNISPGTYTYGLTEAIGVLASTVLIENNYIGAQLANGTSLGTAFLNNAIYLASTISSTWHTVGSTGLRINYNDVNRAWRGVKVNSFGTNYRTAIQSNTVTLLNDATLLLDQRGIELGSTPSGTISTNRVSAVNTTNTLVTLVHVGSSIGAAITCNTLSSSYQGFNFNNNSNNSIWKGNSMTTLQRGMVLSNNGIIGTQGGSGSPSDNRWNGAWTGTNYGTYVSFGSDAINSKLWVKNTSVFVPQNPGFVSFAQSYAVSTNTPTTTGSYACSGPPPGELMAQSSPSVPLTMSSANATISTIEEMYIGENNLYRFLDANPVVKNSSIAYLNFYNAKANTSFDKFKQVEANLYSDQVLQAQSINNAVALVNTVESNYKSYYTLYTKFKTNNFSSADSSLLIGIAALCPGIHGSVVYQSRALYSLIYKTLRTYKENCNSELLSISRIINSSHESKILENSWSVELFPNPTKGNFTLLSKAESETLNVAIMDITGKLIYSNVVKTNNFIVNLELEAYKGIYLVKITNSKNESVSKKLLLTD